MSAAPDTATASSEWAERIKKWREELLKSAWIGLPLAFLGGTFQAIAKPLVSQPWHALIYVLPLVLLAWGSWRLARRSNMRSLHWAFPAFLVTYCLAFALLSTSDLLVWSRTPPRSEEETPRAWLVPANWGDWRYRIAPVSTVPANIAIVMLDAPQTNDPILLRAEKIELVKLIAKAPRVRGVAFDFYFDGRSIVDSVLCDAIAALAVPVFAGYTIKLEEGLHGPVVPNENPLEKCIPFATHEGHLLAWADGDRVVRTLPLYWAADDRKPAFSLQIAKTLAANAKRELPIPSARMLRYLQLPADSFEQIDRAQVKLDDLSDRFIFVGQHSDEDRFLTPFGTYSGTWVQAAAMHSLLTETYMKRASGVASALLVFAACYVIVLLAAAQKTVKTLVLAAFVISVAVVALAAIAAYFRTWLDAVYAIAACWLLVPLVVVLRRAVAAKPAST